MILQPERSEGAPLAFLKFYGSDFLNATAAWTMEERGVYITLLWYSWVNGGLPGEIERIDRMAPGAKACWSVLDSKFPISPDGMRRNARQERDREAMRAKSLSAAERGKRGAEQRWGSHSNGMAIAIQQSSLNHGNGMASQRSEVRDQSSEFRDQTPEQKHTLNGVAVEPVSSVNDPKPSRAEARPRIGTDADFKAFWDIYPRRVGKGAARAAFFKALPLLADEMELIEEAAARHMIQAVEAYASKPETRALEQKFIPHPVTWLNQRRYIDELEAIRKAIFR